MRGVHSGSSGRSPPPCMSSANQHSSNQCSQTLIESQRNPGETGTGGESWVGSAVNCCGSVPCTQLGGRRTAHSYSRSCRRESTCPSSITLVDVASRSALLRSGTMRARKPIALQAGGNRSHCVCSRCSADVLM